MSLSKQIGKKQKETENEYKGIIMELLKNIYGLSVVIEDMRDNKVSNEEIDKVLESVNVLLDNFGVSVSVGDKENEKV